MSYLNRPRINLGGTFFTDPSTINNNPAHYNETSIDLRRGRIRRACTAFA